MMEYLLSVDGGGTKTEFCLSDMNGNILGTVTTGSGSFKASDLKQSSEQLRMGMAQLKEAYQVTSKDIVKAVFGMSGYDSKKDRAIIMDQILQLGFAEEQIYLCNDGVLAFYAQTPEPGIAVIAGTGSIVLGIDHKGDVRRSGGWGYHFSDIGSGYWMGCEILKRTLLYCDQCCDYDPIFTSVKDYFQVAEMKELPHKVTEIRNAYQIAGLSYEVVKAAEANNPLALEILKQGAAHLAVLATGMYQQLDINDEELKIVFSGGVLSVRIYEKLLKRSIMSKINKPIQFFAQKNRPSLGGIKLAERLLGKR